MQLKILASLIDSIPMQHVGPLPARITLSFNPTRFSWAVNRKLRPAYVMAINECQGLTLQKAVLDFRADLLGLQ